MWIELFVATRTGRRSLGTLLEVTAVPEENNVLVVSGPNAVTVFERIVEVDPDGPGTVDFTVVTELHEYTGCRLIANVLGHVRIRFAWKRLLRL